MEFTPSRFQSAIYDAVENTNDSLIIDAVAGSGKTTTIVNAVDLIPTKLKSIFVAFNKAIADELGKKLPDHVKASTMHSLGFRAWMSYAGRCSIDKDKIYKIMDKDEIYLDVAGDDERKIRYQVKAMVSFAKGMGMVPKGAKGMEGLIEDTVENWNHIINHFNVDFKLKRDGLLMSEFQQLQKDIVTKAIAAARRILKLNIMNKKTVDFDDMQYLPVIYNVDFPEYDVVMVDEAQDISEIQRVMLRKSLKKTGRLIAVGDPYQAIYGFRGADSKSLANIADEFGSKSLPLSICYRCPKSVVEAAKVYVPHIEAADDAPEGKVEELGEYDVTKHFEPSDYVICRNNAPLVKLAFELIKVKKPCGIVGRDIGQRIKSLITSLKADNLIDLRQKLREWERKEIKRVKDNDPNADLGFIQDRIDATRTFIECSGGDTVAAVIQAVDDLFSPKAPGAVILSSIHKAKGLEADRVLILDEHLMPSKFATQEWMLEQENNLMYVAITRAKDYLGYITTPGADTGKDGE